MKEFKFLRNSFVFTPANGREIVVPNRYTTTYQREIYIAGVLVFRMGEPRDCWTRRNITNHDSKLIFDDGWFAETNDFMYITNH